MEELWLKGEAGVDFDCTPRIIEPDHFQCMFMIMGCIFSVQLIVILWDILTAPPTNHLLDSENPHSRVDQSDRDNQFYSFMSAGLSSCLLITLVNLYLFSTALWTPITYDTSERKYLDSTIIRWMIATPARSITRGEYEYDMKMLIDNKSVAFAILGYGAVTSFIFIFVAMMKSIGKTHFVLLITCFGF